MRPRLFLMVGLPGAGKTTVAREIADKQHILRLTPDEWMAPLFGDSEAGARREILEGRMIWVAHQVLCSGASAVLDFGCWAADERYAIRAIAELSGADFEMRYIQTEESERRERATHRWQQAPETSFAMSNADHERFVALFQPPSARELAYAPIPLPPAGFDTWPHWASVRWPTLGRLDV